MKPDNSAIYDFTDGAGVQWTLYDEHDTADEFALYLACFGDNGTYGRLQLNYDLSDGDIAFLWHWVVTDENNMASGSNTLYEVARQEMLDCMAGFYSGEEDEE